VSNPASSPSLVSFPKRIYLPNSHLRMGCRLPNRMTRLLLHASHLQVVKEQRLPLSLLSELPCELPFPPKSPEACWTCIRAYCQLIQTQQSVQRGVQTHFFLSLSRSFSLPDLSFSRSLEPLLSLLLPLLLSLSLSLSSSSLLLRLRSRSESSRLDDERCRSAGERERRRWEDD